MCPGLLLGGRKEGRGGRGFVMYTSSPLFSDVRCQMSEVCNCYPTSVQRSFSSLLIQRRFLNPLHLFSCTYMFIPFKTSISSSSPAFLMSGSLSHHFGSWLVLSVSDFRGLVFDYLVCFLSYLSFPHIRL